MNDFIRKGILPHDDFHIDRINPWIKKTPDKWVKKSLEYFDFANLLIKDRKDFKIILAIQLASIEKSVDITQIDLDTLPVNKLSYSPPSLYIYKDNDTFGKWVNESIKKHPFQYKDFICFFHQEVERNCGDYANTIFIVNP